MSERAGCPRRVHCASRGRLGWLVQVGALTPLWGRGFCSCREQLRCPVAATRHACGDDLPGLL